MSAQAHAGSIAGGETSAQLLELKGSILEKGSEDDSGQIAVPHETAQEGTGLEDRSRRLDGGGRRGGCRGSRLGRPSRQGFRQAREFYRFGKIVVHAFGEAAIAVEGHGAGGEGDDGNAGGDRLADLMGRLVAVHHRHSTIHQDQGKVSMPERFHRLCAVGDGVGAVSQLLELRKNHLAVGGVVLGHQDFFSMASRDGLDRSSHRRQPLVCGGRPVGNCLFKRRGEPEGRSLPGSALHSDCAAHHFDQLF